VLSNTSFFEVRLVVVLEVVTPVLVVLCVVVLPVELLVVLLVVLLLELVVVLEDASSCFPCDVVADIDVLCGSSLLVVFTES